MSWQKIVNKLIISLLVYTLVFPLMVVIPGLMGAILATPLWILLRELGVPLSELVFFVVPIIFIWLCRERSCQVHKKPVLDH